MPSKQKEFEHKVQFQLFGNTMRPIDGTQFWVTLKIIQIKTDVKISFPVINFQTGIQRSDNTTPFTIAGGFIQVVNGYLPEDIRPIDPVYRSFLVPNNDGALPIFLSEEITSSE